MGGAGTRGYARLMRLRPRFPAFRRPLLLLPVLLVASAGCLVQPQAQAGGPTPVGDGASRLPQLLQQLQAGGSALELFDASPTSTTTVTAAGTSTMQAQVLGVQDSPTKTPTPAGTFSGGTTSTPTPTATPHLIAPTATPKPATPTPTPSPTPGASPTTGP